MFIVTRALRTSATKIFLTAILALSAYSGIATAATNSAPVISGTPSSTFADADAIVEHLAGEMRDGDVIAVMSNG